MVSAIVDALHQKSSIGLIGLGVMGKSLCRNLARHGFQISMFNRHLQDVEEHIAVDFKAAHPELNKAKAFDHLGNFVRSLERPRKIMLMIKAGKPLDQTLDRLVPLLDEGDIIIDGGNSHFEDTRARQKKLVKQGIKYIGAGISGGEEGALKGPSIMPGGDIEAYQQVAPFLETIAAKDLNGNACCSYIGPEGSGHFVKTIHNGIEYAEMQLLAEVYFLLRASGKNPDEIAAVLASWQTEGLDSFLLEITIEILRKKEGEAWLIDKILDKAGNKGTGNWSTVAASQLGIPATMIASALFARYISSFKEKRMQLANIFKEEAPVFECNTQDLREGYAIARIVNHCQGFELLAAASHEYNWSLHLAEIARIWTNGCIIRSGLMEMLIPPLKHTESLLLHPEIIEHLKIGRSSLKKVVLSSVAANIASPCFQEALNYLNAMGTSTTAASLIHAQRDYFGAHTYQRHDQVGTFHTKWKNTNHD